MQVDSFSLKTSDGALIKGKYFRGASEKSPIIVVAGAIGISSKYYSDFCEFCQNQDFTVITFDYRGVGESEYHSDFDLVDWFEQDFETVLSYALNFNVPVFLVGHSFGALCATVSANKGRIQGLFAFGSGSGALVYLPFWERMKALFLFYIVGPTFYFLRIPVSQWLTGMQFNIPVSFFFQWRALVINPGFWLGSKKMESKFKSRVINFPIKIFISKSDLWTPIDSARDYYSRLAVEEIDYEIVSGLKQRINHSQYFSSKRAEHLWPQCLDWIKKHSSTSS